jgi:hypothetical protein
MTALSPGTRVLTPAYVAPCRAGTVRRLTIDRTDQAGIRVSVLVHYDDGQESLAVAMVPARGDSPS